MPDKVRFEENPLKGVQLDTPDIITSTDTPQMQLNSVMMDYVNQDIQAKAKANYRPTQLYSDFTYEQSAPNPLRTFQDNRIKLEDYSIDASQTHTKLFSGELVPLYKDYLPNIDNEDRLARQQNTSEKWLNGISKFGTTTWTTVLGGTVGTVYGVVDAIAEGSFQSVFDNDFTKYMDDLNTRMRYNLPNYYTRQEKDKGFFGQWGDANFWADKVLGAAGFTVGAIISEGIWAAATGGASLSTNAARMAGSLGKAGKWAKTFIGTENATKGMATYKSWMKAPLFNAYRKTGMLSKEAAVSAAKTAEAINTARFLATSSGYEAGVESLQYKKEAEENFYRNFYELNGRQPNTEEIAEFNNRNENAANGVFAANMAILAPSNAVMFGSLFNIKNPLRAVSKGVNKKLFGIGLEKTVDDLGKVTYKALSPTKKQKIFSGIYAATKPIATEGLWEEGGQGVTSKTASHWVESSYNPKYNSNTMAIADAMYQSFGEQYGTKEGWEEIGIGAIIGGGASVIQGKGKFKEVKEIQEARKYQEGLVDRMNTFSQDVLVKRMMMNAKIQNAVERQESADSKGNLVESELSNQDKILAEVEFSYSIGDDLNDLKEKYQIALENVTEDQWKEAGISNPEEYIGTVMEGYSNMVDSYKKNIEYAQAIYGIDVTVGTDSNLKTHAQALAYTITVGENAATLMEESLSEIERKIGSEGAKSIRIQSELNRLSANTRQKIYSRNKKIEQLRETQEKLLKKITTLQNAPKETQGDRVAGNELGNLNLRLVEINDQISQLEAERSVQAEEISQEVSRRKGINDNAELSISVGSEFITGQDLADIEKKLERIDEVINSYEGSNPQVYRELIGLSNYYKNAEKSFLDYQNAAIALSSGNVRISTKKMGGLLGKLFDPKNKGKEKDGDFTSAFLNDVVGNYMATKARQFNEEGFAEETVTQKEANSPITYYRTNEIAEKVRNGEKLSRREAKLFADNEEAVVKRIKQLNNELGDNPNNEVKVEQQEQKTEKELLKERLETALKEKYFPLAYIGENYEEIVKDKPSKKDVDRYRELLRKDNKKEEEVQEQEELRQKLQNWRALDSAVVGAQSLADIINLIEQLDTQIEQDQTVHTVTEEHDTQIVDDMLASEVAVVYELTQNTTGNATAKLLKDGRIKLSHIKIDTVLNRLGGTFEILNSKGRVLKSTNYKAYAKAGFTFRITPQNGTGSIDVTITEGNALEMEQADFFAMQQSLNLYVVDTGQRNWTYKDVYEVVGTEFVEKESDFIDDDIQGDSYELRAGDEVEFYYDSEDPWNMQQAKALSKEEITEEEYRDSLKVYVRKNGQNFGTLKAIRKGAIDESILAIRDKAVAIAEQGKSDVFGRTKVSQVIMGSPKFIMDGNRKPTQLPFTDRGLEQVVTTGYIMDNEFSLADRTVTDVDQSFVGRISKNQQGKKIPVVVIRKGAHNIAYPITMSQRPDSQVDRYVSILEDQNMDDNAKVIEVNSLLISLGIQPDTYNLTDLSQQDKLDRIGNDLANKTLFVTADDLTDNYDKKNLKFDATIKIDLEDLNRSISSPKLRIDLDGFSLYETAEVKYETLTELETALSNLSLEVDNMIMKDYVDSNGNAIENRFTEVYADDSVIKDPQTHLERLHNVRMLVKAYPLMPPKAKQLMGANKVGEIQRLMDRIEFIKKQLDTKTHKDIQNKKNELKC